MDSEGLDRIGWVRKDTDTDTDTDGIGWNLEGYGRDGTLVDIFAPVPLTEELLTVHHISDFVSSSVLHCRALENNYASFDEPFTEPPLRSTNEVDFCQTHKVEWQWGQKECQSPRFRHASCGQPHTQHIYS